MRLLIPIALFVVFAVWFLYRWLIKRDVTEHLDTVYPALFFFGVWAVLYFTVFN